MCTDLPRPTTPLRHLFSLWTSTRALKRVDVKGANFQRNKSFFSCTGYTPFLAGSTLFLTSHKCQILYLLQSYEAPHLSHAPQDRDNIAP